VSNSNLLRNYHQIHQHKENLPTFWLFRFAQYVLDETDQMNHQGTLFFARGEDLGHLKSSLFNEKLLKISLVQVD